MFRGSLLTPILVIFATGLTACDSDNPVAQFLEIGPNARAVRGGRAKRVAAKLQDSIDQLRSVYKDAQSYIVGFQSLEDRYRSIPDRLERQFKANKISKNTPNLTVLAARNREDSKLAFDMLEMQKDRTAVIERNFQTRLADMKKTAADVDKICAEKSGPANKKTAGAVSEKTASCQTFQNGYTQLVSRVDAITRGFDEAGKVYLASKETLLKMSNQPVTADPKSEPVAAATAPASGKAAAPAHP